MRSFSNSRATRFRQLGHLIYVTGEKTLLRSGNGEMHTRLFGCRIASSPASELRDTSQETTAVELRDGQAFLQRPVSNLRVVWPFGHVVMWPRDRVITRWSGLEWRRVRGVNGGEELESLVPQVRV
jgi:hypothetical protein